MYSVTLLLWSGLCGSGALMGASTCWIHFCNVRPSLFFPLFLWPVIQLIHWPWREELFSFQVSQLVLWLRVCCDDRSTALGWILAEHQPHALQGTKEMESIRLGFRCVRKSHIPQRLNTSCCARLPGIAVPTWHFGELELKLTKIISLQEIAPWPGHGTHQQVSETERLKLTQVWDSAECANTGLTTTCTVGNIWSKSSQTTGCTPAVTKRLLPVLSSSSCLHEVQWSTLTITSDHLIEAEVGDGMERALQLCWISSKVLCCTAVEAPRPPQWCLWGQQQQI